VIEALFMGSGPLRPADDVGGCPQPGYWTGFPRGVGVRVRISTEVPAVSREAIRAAAEQVSAATLGALTATVEVVADADPRPGPFEVTATVVSDPVAEGCLSDIGCLLPEFVQPGLLRGARAVLPLRQTSNAFAHDVVGHGLMGMCHIDGRLIGGPERSLMSGGRGVFSDQISPTLTTLDLEAARAVYASSLSPGAVRADFVQAGLIDP
jgi:hypothetical protein